MSEPSRPPVAVRITRPYESEDELLAHELETIGKTSVILIGGKPTPIGVVLRFEMVLASGAVALRGEGRVLGHKEEAFRGQPGLALRFTRLDPKSKALVDRATGLREARAQATGVAPESHASLEAASPASARSPASRQSAAPASQPPRTSQPPVSRPPVSQPDTAVAHALTEETPEAPAAGRAAAATSGAPPPPPPSEPIPMVPPIPALISVPPPPLPPPSARDAILARLRERSAALTPERVAEILAAKQRS